MFVVLEGAGTLRVAEEMLPIRAGQSGYSGGFVEHYVGRLVYPRGMPRQMELIAGVSVVVVPMPIYRVLLTRLCGFLRSPLSSLRRVDQARVSG